MTSQQLSFEELSPKPKSRETILDNVKFLAKMHRKGLLGGEYMPEDSNPGLLAESKENYLYFTLPMALNYQRNSYKLWEAAKTAYSDKGTKDIFSPSEVIKMTSTELKEKLTKYKVALQPNKQTEIWQKISNTICDELDGDIRNLFVRCNYSIPDILEFVQKTKKKRFPYLSGAKICIYWLYVIEQYAAAKYSGREYLSIAPDTHVIQASVRLGVVKEEVVNKSSVREEVSAAWGSLLKGTGLLPIDIHTPLWLWSRSGFPQIQQFTNYD